MIVPSCAEYPAMRSSRRSLLKLAGMAPAAKLFGIQIAAAEDRDFRHALTLYNDNKYPPGFAHFDYVNPAAPKGGRLRLGLVGSFDNLNPYTFKGETASGVTNDSLMTVSFDEPATQYGLVASEVWHPEDRSAAVFRLRPEARFHDGTPITPDDVIWSLDALRKAQNFDYIYYQNIAKAEQTGEHEVTFTFNVRGIRELPMVVGSLTVLPKHWWTGKDAQGRQRNIIETTLEPPLGSGSYFLADMKRGASVVMRRVPDYWAKDLAVNVGQNNFEEIEYVYFLDENSAFEAFKAGLYDWHTEGSPKMWKTGYDFPAARTGKIIREEFPIDHVAGMDGWAINMRRPKFQDIRVRRALNYAFDFEWANENLFYGQYIRSRSYFNNSEFEAKGLPSSEELALLAPLKDLLPPEVFTSEYKNPVNGSPRMRRKNLHKAARLLSEAGWNLTQDGTAPVLKNAAGEALTIEFLVGAPDDPLTLYFRRELELLGITVTLQPADSPQYTWLIEKFDFDIMMAGWQQSLSPGREQRNFWGSEAATRSGSGNQVGIVNPAIDALIEKLILAPDRKSLITACRALDRALIWNHYVVPMWYTTHERIAHWNRFSRPDKLPKLSIGFPDIWWWDEEKARKVDGT